MITLSEFEHWYPKEGEQVYISHAITKHKFVKATFNYWKGGCLFATTETHKEYRLHPRHTAMRPIVRLTTKDLL
jgi:hypothetical protein